MLTQRTRIHKINVCLYDHKSPYQNQTTYFDLTIHKKCPQSFFYRIDGILNFIQSNIINDMLVVELLVEPVVLSASVVPVVLSIELALPVLVWMTLITYSYIPLWYHITYHEIPCDLALL